ncbi:class I adenylate cyclase [uncultured Methylophaga sp.]|uniref:class I adenylate cyclase n=1 Tax=uncultured Methylophaga sp. TaxID=285271 RepID=UPI00262730F9|nr:class I adenylate cyclase [uncultured Methylophaga sp.]
MDRVQAHRFFQAHNHERIHRLLQLAPPRHSLLLELLPFLFHINAKVLPGYVNDDTPAGLIDYRPDKLIVDRAQQLEKSFRYRRRALRSYPLQGLYLINPHGLLSYPQQAQFELWLLHSQRVNTEQKSLLEEKLKRICDWAGKSGLRLQPRLLSSEDLSMGKLSHWDRDQFYSSGLVLAGSQPYWWFTSPDEDRHYADSIAELQAQRMLNQVSLVDFGEVTEFESGPVFQQALAALDHSLDHGNQLLNLHYLDACLQQPAAMSLAPRLKQQIYLQQTETAALDPQYLRLLQLEDIQPAQALREAFYRQSQEKLSKTVRQALLPWRRSFIAKLAEYWHWDADFLQQRDEESASLSFRRQQFQLQGQSAKALLQRLQQWGQQHHAPETLTSLRRKHRLRHEPALDQVACLPLAMRPDSNDDRLYLTRFNDSQTWYLSRQALNNPRGNTLFQHDSLLQVLAFAIANRLLSRSNWLSVNDQQQTIRSADVLTLSQQLLKTPLAEGDLVSDASTLAAPETFHQVWLFINLAQQPEDKLARQGLQLSSKLNDPLNYSSSQQSLVLSIDGLVQSSFGLFYSFQFQGDAVVPETLRYLLSWPPSAQAAVKSWCPTAIFGQAISQRLDDLLGELFSVYHRHTEQGRFLLDIAGQPYQLNWQQQQVSFEPSPRASDIWPALANQRRSFSALWLDQKLDKTGLLKTILPYQTPRSVSVFVLSEARWISCYFIDEFGNLLHQQIEDLNESILLSHWQAFLSSVKHGNQLQQLRFYRLQQRQTGWQVTPLALPQHDRGYLPVRITQSSTAGDANCTLRCGQHQFDGRADDPALFAPVQTLVQNLPHNYPVLISQLQFADEAYHPAAVYIEHKLRLQHRLNEQTAS